MSKLLREAREGETEFRQGLRVMIKGNVEVPRFAREGRKLNSDKDLE